MTLSDIELRVLDIEKCKDDPEVAHSLEDQLREDFIKYIAYSNEFSDIHDSIKAQKVLETNKIAFPRWCA